MTMSEIEQKVDRTNELLERIISIQEDLQGRQKKILLIYKRVLLVTVLFAIGYIGLTVYLL